MLHGRHMIVQVLGGEGQLGEGWVKGGEGATVSSRGRVGWVVADLERKASDELQDMSGEWNHVFDSDGWVGL